MKSVAIAGGLLFALWLAGAPAARADTLIYTAAGTTESDESANLPVNATVAFTLGNGTLTVTLTNNLEDTFNDSENLSGLSFQITSNGTPLLALPGGSTITDNSTKVVNDGESSNIVQNQLVTPATSSVSWSVQNLGTKGSIGSGVTTGSANNINLGTDAFVLSTGTGKSFNGTYSIVGPTNGSGVYTGTQPPNTCTKDGNCAGDPIAGTFNGQKQFTGEMVYQTITFSFNVTGLTTSSVISNVWFIFGNDGPDQDDFLAVDPLDPADPASEPASVLLCGIGLALVAGSGLRRWRAAK